MSLCPEGEAALQEAMQAAKNASIENRGATARATRSCQHPGCLVRFSATAKEREIIRAEIEGDHLCKTIKIESNYIISA